MTDGDRGREWFCRRGERRRFRCGLREDRDIGGWALAIGAVLALVWALFGVVMSVKDLIGEVLR